LLRAIRQCLQGGVDADAHRGALEADPVDFFNGETRSAEYRQNVNEMGEVPVLVEGARKLSQSGVILTRLSEQSGRFGSDDPDKRLEILRWILFDNHKFTSYLATYRFLVAFAKSRDPAVMEFLAGVGPPAPTLPGRLIGRPSLTCG
jgi:glutathione S-transferase